MDLTLQPEHRAFREAIDRFLEESRTRWPGAHAGREERIAWQKELIAHGYAARTIPREYGGYGAEPDVMKSRLIAEAFARSGAPGPMASQGISMLVPTLLEMGTEEQKRR